MHRSLRAILFGLTTGTAAVFTALVAPSPAQAWTYKVLYSFCAKPNCMDGYNPIHLLIDSAGNLFGVNTNGGKRGGTLFELSPRADGRWHYKVLFSPFSAISPIIMDAAGNLYGTTFNAGKHADGSIYELLPPQSGGKWRYKTLYNFCRSGTPACLDGSLTQAGLTYAGQATGAPYDGVSPLFGSTEGGGGIPGYPGVVFKLQPKDAGQRHYQVIHTFCSAANCADGSNPGRDGLIADASDDLFGTTRTGGVNKQGTVFALYSKRNGKEWREHTLHALCSRRNCVDGASGEGGLLLDAVGNLTGITGEGGNSCTYNTAGCGVLFQEPNSGGPAGYRVLHAFCSEAKCRDGAAPVPGVITNPFGAFFGITARGGNTVDANGGAGVVYEYDGSFQVLHAFCAEAGCTDGEYPAGGMVIDSFGNLFGTTTVGGQYGYGVVYELSP